MHLAPRRLIIMGCVGGEVEPWRSILPGCMLSIALIRVFMRRPLGKVAVASPRVVLSQHVDDAGQYAECEERKAAKWLVHGAVAFECY